MLFEVEGFHTEDLVRGLGRAGIRVGVGEQSVKWGGLGWGWDGMAGTGMPTVGRSGGGFNIWARVYFDWGGGRLLKWDKADGCVIIKSCQCMWRCGDEKWYGMCFHYVRSLFVPLYNTHHVLFLWGWVVDEIAIYLDCTKSTILSIISEVRHKLWQNAVVYSCTL